MNPIQQRVQCGGKEILLETGKIAKQADGSVWVRMGDSIVLVTVVSAKERKEGIDFFPLTVRLPGEALRRRPGPRQLLPPRGPAHREGDARLPHHRPLLPPALPRGLQQRDADHRQRDLLRPGERRRRAGADRRLGGARSSPTSPSTAPSPACAWRRVDGQFVANPTLGPARRQPSST